MPDLDLLAERIASRHLDKLFFTKNTEWESEREHRFVVRSPNEYEYVDVSRALMAVVRGPESAADSEYVLGLVARELDIALGHFLWDHNDPILVGREVR